MAESKVSRRYAKSLMGLATERNVAGKVFEDMSSFLKVCHDSRDLHNLLRTPIVDTLTKDKILKEVFGKSFDPISIAFMSIVTRKGRESSLEDIAREFISQYKKSTGVNTVRITTAIPLDHAMRANILALVTKPGTESTELIETVDRDLIGGFVLQAGDTQIDASVSRQLRKLKNEFDDRTFVAKV